MTRRTFSVVARVVIAAAMASAAHAEEPEGATLDLAPVNGKLFVPAGAKRGAATIDLLVHFHGDVALMRRQFAASGMTGALLVINHNGLSAAYSKPFADAAIFGKTLDTATNVLRKQGTLTADGTIGVLRVSFFSAGYGAVREVLKQPEYFDRIDALISADSIYAGFTGDAKARRVEPEHMKDFRRFAEAAAARKKVFVLTHSSQHTPTYASTTETANDLVAHIRSERVAIEERGPGEMKIVSRVEKGRFIVIGFAGGEARDHMDHLRQIGWTWELAAARRDDAK